MIHKSVSDVLPQARKRSLSIDLSLESDLPAIYVDKDKIRRVVTNLLGNAVKFSKEGTSILVRARMRARTNIEVPSFENFTALPRRFVTTRRILSLST